jgi:hypothetical protein
MVCDRVISPRTRVCHAATTGAKSTPCQAPSDASVQPARQIPRGSRPQPMEGWLRDGGARRRRRRGRGAGRRSGSPPAGGSAVTPPAPAPCQPQACGVREPPMLVTCMPHAQHHHRHRHRRRRRRRLCRRRRHPRQRHRCRHRHDHNHRHRHRHRHRHCRDHDHARGGATLAHRARKGTVASTKDSTLG